jgi:hypothetical protein
MGKCPYVCSIPSRNPCATSNRVSRVKSVSTFVGLRFSLRLTLGTYAVRSYTTCGVDGLAIEDSQ